MRPLAGLIFSALQCGALGTRLEPRLGRGLLQATPAGQAEPTDTKIFVADFSDFPPVTYPSKWCKGFPPKVTGAASCDEGVVIKDAGLSSDPAINLVNVTYPAEPAPMASTYTLTNDQAAELIQKVNSSQVRRPLAL
jgi:hypothetical protein